MIKSRSYDFGAEFAIHPLTADCDTFSNEEKSAVVAPVNRVEDEVAGFEAMLALSYLRYQCYLLCC